MHSCQEEYCNEMKQKHQGDQFDLAEADFQEADHPSTFMKLLNLELMHLQVPGMTDIKSYLQGSFGMAVLTVLKNPGTKLKYTMDELVQATYLILKFKKHTLRKLETATLISWMKYMQHLRSRRMHVHSKVH